MSRKLFALALILLCPTALVACGSDDVENAQTAVQSAAQDATDEAKTLTDEAKDAATTATDEARDAATTATDKAKGAVEDRPGDPEVWKRIEEGTDCDALQQEFDQATENAERREAGDPLRDLSLKYADAAEKRMNELGCS